MAFTTETQIWLQDNKIEVKNVSRRGKTKYQAIIDFGLRAINGKDFQFDVAQGESDKEAVQTLCDQNNILSPWEIAKLKQALIPKKK